MEGSWGGPGQQLPESPQGKSGGSGGGGNCNLFSAMNGPGSGGWGGGLGDGSSMQGYSSGLADGSDSPASFAARVAAAAAAAVEKPTAMASREAAWKGNHQYQRRAQQHQHDAYMGNMIQKAQKEAERRQHDFGDFDIQTAQSQAAWRRGKGGKKGKSKQDEELGEMIRNAQMKNMPSAQADARRAALASYAGKGNDDLYTERRQLPWPVQAQDLMGNWIDMQGNSVLVYNVDAYEMRLMASVSRPMSGRDLQLGMRPTDDEEGWICGNATLDYSASSMDEVHWLGPNGRYSVWTRGRM